MAAAPHRRLWLWILSLSVAALCLASDATAKSVTPRRSGEAATVRAQPDGTSHPVGLLENGDRAEVVNDVHRWWRVRLGSGIEGFVSKASTREVQDGAPTTPIPDPPPARDRSPSPGTSAGVEKITVRTVSQVSDLAPASPPQPGSFRVHLIDVATGLALLVQGHDFTLLFDGGSNDDSATGKRNRLVAYLFAALGPSGPSKCVPDGDGWQEETNPRLRIDHLVLSHPHKDHNSLLKDVFDCYEVPNVWDSGAVNPTDVHRAFLQAVAADSGVHYHTAAAIPATRQINFDGQGPVTFPTTVTWTKLSENDQQSLGTGAMFTVLHADGTSHPTDWNQNSLVLRVDLGHRSLLLVGDTEGGARKLPSEPVGLAEKALLASHRKELHADILQVGHHGSLTSSRHDFIAAVAPKWALVSAGPFPYNGRTLPDPEIVKELMDSGATVLRTDAHDGQCPVQDRIGEDEDRPPGGCDNFVLDISP